MSLLAWTNVTGRLRGPLSNSGPQEVAWLAYLITVAPGFYLQN